MDTPVVNVGDHDGSVVYTFTSQQQTAGEMNEGLFW